jgi:hypothetical protein
LTRAETLTVAALEEGVPALVEAREVVGAFQAMVRGNELGRFEGWIRRAEASLVASFARGIGQGRAAVQAAITLPWSNGQTEGQITKLKLVKRRMYGRGKIDLLQARLIGPAPLGSAKVRQSPFSTPALIYQSHDRAQDTPIAYSGCDFCQFREMWVEKDRRLVRWHGRRTAHSKRLRKRWKMRVMRYD